MFFLPFSTVFHNYAKIIIDIQYVCEKQRKKEDGCKILKENNNFFQEAMYLLRIAFVNEIYNVLVQV